MKTLGARLFVAFSTFLLLFFFTSFSFAQKEKVASPSPSLGVNPSAKPTTKVEYALPYPGILPDHPLYPLKMVRDRVLGWFIASPSKKAEYNLLMADKRLASGIFLLEKGKAALAEETFSKGEKYLEMALEEVEKTQKMGQDTSALISKLSLATLKHQESLRETLLKIPEDYQGGIKESLTRAEKGVEWVKINQKKKLDKIILERKLGRRPGLTTVEAREK